MLIGGLVENRYFKLFVCSSLRSKVDGRDPMTLRAVMSNENFSDIIEELTMNIAKGALHSKLRVHAVACTTGFHRADVTARMTSAVCNSITTDVGKRCLNMLHLPLCREVSTVLHHSMQIAMKWLEAPWTCAEPVWPQPPIERPEAWNAFQACLDSR